MVSKLHRAPLCNLSCHIKSFFYALVVLHHTLRWPILLWYYIIITFNANNGICPIITQRPQEERSLPQSRTAALGGVKKIQKHAVLSHWSSFSWILGLTTLVHSLAGDDGAHLWPENGTAQVRKAAGLMSGRSSKPKLGLEVTLLSLCDTMWKWIWL